MDLSQYLETMKNLPERFSNLNFWRGVRKLRDKMVDAFDYVGEWGNGIEGQILDINGSISGLKYSNTTRDSRISALENAGGGGGGALVFNSNHQTFNPTSVEVLESNLDSSESGSLLVPYPKVIYARFIGTLSNLEANSIIVNAMMTGSFAVSNGQQYSTTVQLHDEPMYAVRVGDTSYKLYTAWIPFAVKTKGSFRVTMPNLTVYYTTAVM